MTLNEAILARHSVRRYTDKKIDAVTREALQAEADKLNRESGLNMQLVFDEPEAFGGGMAKYGNFEGCHNYIAIVGKKGDEEKSGYYGEKLVLFAQQLGLNTCWVALTFSKSKTVYKLNRGEKLIIVIALGYGKTQGHERKTKSIGELCRVDGEMPTWFKSAMQAVQFAPTAINQQKFLFTLKGSAVEAKSPFGICTKIDLGIAKCHFEIGAGNADFSWK